MKNISEIIQEIVPGPKTLEKPTWCETADSPQHGLHVNSLLGLSVNRKLKSKVHSKNESFASFSIKFQK